MTIQSGWLTLPEVAAELSKVLKAPPVSEAELLGLALAGHLTISVRLPAITAWYFNPDELLDVEEQIIHPGMGGVVDLGRPTVITREVQREFPARVWNVVMERNGKRGLESRYLRLLNVNVLLNDDPEGALIAERTDDTDLRLTAEEQLSPEEQLSGSWWQLQKELTDSATPVWPKGSEFLLPTAAIDAIRDKVREQRESNAGFPFSTITRNEALHHRNKVVDPRERTTHYRIIAALLRELNIELSGDRIRNQAALEIERITERHLLTPVSPRTSNTVLKHIEKDIGDEIRRPASTA